MVYMGAPLYRDGVQTYSNIRGGHFLAQISNQSVRAEGSSDLPQPTSGPGGEQLGDCWLPRHGDGLDQSIQAGVSATS